MLCNPVCVVIKVWSYSFHICNLKNETIIFKIAGNLYLSYLREPWLYMSLSVSFASQSDTWKTLPKFFLYVWLFIWVGLCISTFSNSLWDFSSRARTHLLLPGPDSSAEEAAGRTMSLSTSSIDYKMTLTCLLSSERCVDAILGLWVRGELGLFMPVIYNLKLVFLNTPTS